MKAIRFLALGALVVAVGQIASCGGSSGGGGIAPITPITPIVQVDPLAPTLQSNLASAVSDFGYTNDSGGGGGGDGAGSSGVGGGAGDGAPLRKAVVVVTDANGKFVTGLTDDNGIYLVRFSNFVSPIVAKVVDAGGNTLTSVLEENVPAGKVARLMINPLTDKIVSDVVTSGSVPGTDKNFDGSKIDVPKLVQAKKDLITSINTALGSVGITSTTFDPVKSKYNYDGTGVDAIIESISHTRDAATGATLLRAKLVNVDSPATLISAATPLATANVLTLESKSLTLTKIQNWITETNRCLAIAPTSDVDCADADGTRRASSSYRNNGKDVNEDFRTLASNTDGSNIARSTLRNPTILFVGKYPNSTAAFDDLAVVEVTILQPSIGPNGPDGAAGATSNPVEYTKTIVFRRDDTLTRAKAGNWIAHGNQNLYDFSVSTRYTRYVQQNPARQANVAGNSPSFMRSGIRMFINTAKYNIPTKTYGDANLRAARVTGPGLPAAGVVLAPSNVCGDLGSFVIHNSAGTVSTTAMVSSLATTEFRLNAVAIDGSALATNTIIRTIAGTPGQSSGQTWAIPVVTDFSALQAYNLYKVEFFLNSNPGNTTPDLIEFTRIAAPVTPPKAALSIAVNDFGPVSKSNVTAPQPAAASLVVDWVNNPNAAPVQFTNVYAEESAQKIPSNGLLKFSFGRNVNAAFSLNNRPTSNAVTASALSCNGNTAAFPSLGVGTAGDYREIGLISEQGRARISNFIAWTN